jgi:hypothetical protein
MEKEREKKELTLIEEQSISYAKASYRVTGSSSSSSSSPHTFTWHEASTAVKYNSVKGKLV